MLYLQESTFTGYSIKFVLFGKALNSAHEQIVSISEMVYHPYQLLLLTLNFRQLH